MFTVMVQLDVRPDRLEQFVEGIHLNARASLRDEPGCIRFDVHADVENPLHFYFYEIYTDSDAFYVGHRSAPHYAAWQLVEAECVVPGTKFNNFGIPQFPGDIPERPATVEEA